MNKLRLMCCHHKKNAWSLHHFELPQVSSDKRRFAKQVLSRKLASWDQAINFNPLSANDRWAPKKECSGYDYTASNGKAPVLEIWGVWTTPLLTLLPDPLKPWVVVPARVLSFGQIDLFKNYFDLTEPCKNNYTKNVNVNVIL